MMEIVSDKFFWHKYIEFYESRLPLKANQILEIGIFNGDSIKYWRSKYPKSDIYGIDILQEKESWPKDKKISYSQLDQSDIDKYQQFLKSTNKIFDIVIEDGSHDPLHQKISLIETIPYLKKGSIYILEDIHTSHKEHPLYKKRLKMINSSKGYFGKKESEYFMTLQGLLLLNHFKRFNKKDDDFDKAINYNQSLFSKEELILLNNKIQKIEIFKRTILPDYCYSCGKSDFNYISLSCDCGAELYLASDSMTALIYF